MGNSLNNCKCTKPYPNATLNSFVRYNPMLTCPFLPDVGFIPWTCFLVSVFQCFISCSLPFDFFPFCLCIRVSLSAVHQSSEASAFKPLAASL